MDTPYFTWTNIFTELAGKLLQYRNNRRPLVEWLYSGLGQITDQDGKNFIGYIHNADKTNVTDIDPFSVMAIFNRGRMTRENRLRILAEFKEHFELESDLPTDFNGIPVVDPRRSFFFSWSEDQKESIETLWSMFEKAINGEPFEQEYNKTVARSGIRFSLSMALFWICPNDFLSLDSRIRDYLNAHGYDIKDKAPDYQVYTALIDSIKSKFADGSLDGVDSFCEMSHKAWLDSPSDNQKVWLWSGDETTFESNYLKAGSTVSESVTDFSVFKTKQELRDACKKATNTASVNIPNAYWQFMTEVSVGDIVVIFKNKRADGQNTHLMYGWGTITSELIYAKGDVSPIQRTVEWNEDRPSEPVEDTLLNNSLFFHQANDAQAENIKALLGIGGERKRAYWLGGYTFGSTDIQLDRFLSEGVWEGRGDEKTNTLIQSMKKGDVIILKSTSTKGPNHDKPFMRAKALGIINSECTASKDDNFRFDVEYFAIDEIDFDGSKYGKYRKTLHACEDKAVIDWAKRIISSKTARKIKKVKHKEYIDLLLASKNLILTGAPGTGKTYLAKLIAEEMGAETEFVQFHPSYDYTDFVEGLRPTDDRSFERRDGIFKEFCKKALRNMEDSKKSQKVLAEEQSLNERIYAFLSDAIEGEKPLTLKSGNQFIITEYDERRIRVESKENEKTSRIDIKMSDVREVLEKNVALNIVRDIRDHFGRKFGTQQDSYTFVIATEIRSTKAEKITSVDLVGRKNFVFIIDEINRGEMSKILGELFFSVDPGYRGEKGRVKTQYQNLVDETDVFAAGFFIPENVYIIGTMNDIDRSVESMDFAIRRRFTWKEVLPEDRIDMWDDCKGSWKEEALQRMSRMNALISDGSVGLSAEYCIGPAYFRNLEKNGGDFTKLWKLHLEPLIKEYLRGNRNIKENLEKIKNAFELVDESE